jgi:hypothetical protein
MKIDNQESLLGKKDELSLEKIAYSKVLKDSLKTSLTCLVSHSIYPVMSMVNVLVLSRQGTLPMAAYALGSLT